MASRDIKLAHPRLRIAYLKSIEDWKLHPSGTKPILTHTHRSNIEQAKLYGQPWDKIDNDGDGLVDERDEKVTNAKPGQSKHNKIPSEAIDVAFMRGDGKLDWAMGLFADFYKIMKSHDPGIKWGGKWGDGPHYEI